MESTSWGEEKINAVLQKLDNEKSIKIKVSERGKLKMEKAVPFLIIYRTTAESDNRLVKLLLSEISYLIIPSDEYKKQQVDELILSIAKKLANKFGAFL